MKLTHHGEGACVQMADHLAAMAAQKLELTPDEQPPMSDSERDKKIADVDEEIALMLEFLPEESCDFTEIWQRILKSREAHRAELARGMKEKVTDGAK